MTKSKTELPQPTRRSVALDSLTTRPEAFQPRAVGIQDYHVLALVDALKRGGPLDRIAVWEDPTDGTLVVADGHHRLEAYRREGSHRHIRVDVFRCDYRTARLIPMRDNAKDRLPLSREDKSNWAWHSVKDFRMSKAQTARECGISERTVAYMRKTLVALKKRGENIPDTWAGATALARGDNPDEWDDEARDEWRRRTVDKVMRQVAVPLSEIANRSPEAAADVLERCLGGRLPDVLDWLGYVRSREEDDDIYGFAGGRAEQEAPEPF